MRWEDGPAAPGLPAGDEVHVWTAALALPAQERARLEDLLSPGECERADRFVRPEDRQRYVAAHGILRSLLGRYLGQPPAALAFAPGAQGKPALVPGESEAAGAGGRAGSPDLRFNLSHAGGFAAFAVAVGRDVGVDVETLDRALRPDAIVRRHFPAAEADQILSLPESERRLAFTRSWVCKEAFAKATGLGIGHIPFHSIALEVPAGEGAPALAGSSEAARDALRPWTVVSLPEVDHCGVAVAFGGGPARVRCWRWPTGAPPLRP